MADSKLIPVRCNLDLAPEYIDAQTARFMKGLTPFESAVDGKGSVLEGENEIKLKPNQSNELYVNIPIPAGDNFCVGVKGFPEVNRVYVLVYNSNKDHFIYRLNCSTRTFEICKIDPCFNFQKKPEYFMGIGQITLTLINLVNPDTNEEFIAEELKWTDNYNYQGFLRPNDSIATNGFDPALFPYFAGNYNKCAVVRMGVPTPKHCIKVSEIPTVPGTTGSIVEIQFQGGTTVDEVAGAVTFGGITGSYLVTFTAATNSMKLQTTTNGNEFLLSAITINGTVSNNGTRAILAVSISNIVTNNQKNNKLLFQKWFFTQRNVDVWGRPSEWGVRSSEYVPGINDCISNSNNISRCLELELDAGDPFTNTIELGWLSCTNGQPTIWKREETIFLYEGSNIGEWWKRPRNPNVTYDQVTNKITYKFCREKECDIIPPDEMSRIENPLPKRSAAIMDLAHETSLFNNKSKFNPFPQTLKDKITHKVIPPSQTDLGLRTITIYAAIYNEFLQGPPDFQGRFVAVVPDGNNGYYFGGITSNNQYSGAWAERYQQRFKNKAQSGFCGYLVGAGSVISTQVVEQSDGSLLDDPNHTFGVGQDGTGDGKLVLQKFVFTNVPKGKYIFRFASHLSDPNSDANYRQTSTTMWGLCTYSRQNGRLFIDSHTRERSQEMLVDVCTKDFDNLKDTNKILLVADLAAVVQGGEYKAICRYVYETNKNGYNQTPVELLNVISGNMTNSQITDHNGFMWATTRGRGRTYAIDHIDKCVWSQLRYNQSNVVGMVIEPPIFTQGVLEKPCNRVLIKGKILLQGTNIGISNALVTITRGSSAVTDENGDFEILAHDFVYDYFNGVLRKDKLIINSVCSYEGLCIDLPVQWPQCSSCSERSVTVDDIILTFQNLRGLLSGGVYPLGCVGFDWLGRATYVQQTGYINIPTCIETKTIAPSQVQINIDPNAVFPDEIEYIRFFIGPETTIQKYLTWIADKVEFIDAQGLVNDIAPTQIRIWYGSILEFAKQNQFNVTTAWDFIPENQTKPVLNDRINFFINGDGKFFTKAISSLIKYEATGKYFTIDYTTDLKDLKENALFRLERLKNCTGNEAFREICDSKVEIKNGKAQTNQFILNAFDTYYLNRAMPVPVSVIDTPTTANITTTVTTGNTSVATQQIPVPTPTVLQLRTFGFKFEHFAPSNIWGSGCQIGREQVKNPYEAELIEPYQVMRSGALSPNGQLNYLCYFDDKKKLNFEVPECGGITSVVQKIGIILALCKTRTFIAGFNDNLGRVNGDGTFQAGSIANEFGKPQEIDLYGCHPKDKMSIQMRNGIVMWVDRNRAEAVQSDFTKVYSFTKDKCNAWFKAKVKQVLADDLAYFTGAITPANEYLITNQTLTGDGMSYINSERTYNPLVPETVSFHIGSRDLIQWFGFTYENYAWLDGDILNNQMFSFMQGVPYSHYNGKQTGSFNVFHGVETEKVLDVIFRGQDAFKKKMFYIVTNWCENQLFFSDEITTEAKQKSRLLLPHWYKGAYMSSGTLLCDLNTVPDPTMPTETGPNVLMDGDRLWGNWLRLRLIGDPSKNSDYCEILGIEVVASPFEKS